MHWSRWGDPARAATLPESATGLLRAAFGEVAHAPAVAEEDVRLPAPQLAADVLTELTDLLGAGHVAVDDASRLRHTRGKSTADLLKIRSGDASDAPDAVLRPADHDQVQALVIVCSDHRVALVPFGGGTAVTGGLAPDRDGFAGVVAVDLSRLDQLVGVDQESATAVLQAGVLGPRAEELLAEHGRTLGHFPQSFEYASIGGFAATRSSGQASAGYGRFDALVVGLKVATGLGTLDVGRAPASAAGPDLRQLMLGSEGAFGVITEVTVRVRPRPLTAVYEAWRFESFAKGYAAMRDVVQVGLAPTVLRLSDEAETLINLARPEEIGGDTVGGCLLVAGYEGTPSDVQDRRAKVSARLSDHGGQGPDTAGGQAWAAGRFDGPYLRDALLDHGLLVETLETAGFWSALPGLYSAVRSALDTSLAEQGTQPVVLCHVSHVYETGASLYFTVGARQLDDPLAQWATAKRAATDAMVAAGGTITHHHAVGRDHLPWLEQEVGEVGVEILRAVKARLDPAGVLNPGVLVP